MESRRKVFGVGVNDSGYQVSIYENVNGKRKNIWRCPFYRRWTNMMERCYSDRFHEKNPTYVGCSMCDEWLTFSNFKGWVKKQDWKDKEIDKDLLIDGNMVYSPLTCIIVEREVNAFININKRSRGEFPVGVNFNKRDSLYQCSISIDKKHRNIGMFKDPESAHQAWQRKKLELAIELQAKQTDERVKKGLQRVIDKLTYHIENGIETVSL